VDEAVTFPESAGRLVGLVVSRWIIWTLTRESPDFSPQDRVRLHLERSLSELHELAEHAEDGIPPAVLPGDLAVPANSPHQIVGEQVVENGEITGSKGGVPVSDAEGYRMRSVIGPSGP
jgi:hypothetical protein